MNVINVTDDTIDQLIWKSDSLATGGAVAVVEFTDGTDRSISPEGRTKKRSERMSDLLDDLAGEYNEYKPLKFFRIDYLKNPITAVRFDVQSAPTLLFLQIEEVVGGNTKEWIKAKIDKKISS